MDKLKFGGLAVIKNKKDKNIEQLVVKYDDGTEKVIKKGAIVELGNNENEEEQTLSMEFADCKGIDLTSIVLGFVQMGAEMGLFNNLEEE
nr:hypothetical protein Z964_p0014 [Clostridium novyi A str. GD211209]